MKSPEQKKDIAPQEQPAKLTDLRHLLTYENPKAADYQRLIKEVEKNTLPCTSINYSIHWKEYMRGATESVYELRKYFEDKLNGQVLINLGGGFTPFGRMLDEKGPRAVISVDKYTRNLGSPDDPVDSFRIADDIDVSDNTHLYFIRADMLDFLSRLPDNSVNIEIDGIDDLVIPFPEYHQAVADEIARVTKKGGICFGSGSNSLFELKNKPVKGLCLMEMDALMRTDWEGVKKHTGMLIFEKE